MRAWLARLIGWLLAAYVQLLAATCRIAPVRREQALIAFWHEFDLAAFAVAVRHRVDLPHAAFSTQSFRGAVIAAIFSALALRVEVVPLPPERDRRAGAAFAGRLARLAGEGYSLVVTPDGPLGPYRRAKPGALMVARQSGLPITPWGIAARPAGRLGWRWDRHLVPLPFGSIRVVEGDPITVAPRDRLTGRVAELEQALMEVTRRATEAVSARGADGYH